jgi:hypothetical protein
MRVAFLEPLLVVMPLMTGLSGVIDAPPGGTAAQVLSYGALSRSMSFWASHVAPTPLPTLSNALPVNIMLLTYMQALLAQASSPTLTANLAAAANLDAALAMALELCSDDGESGWGNMRSAGMSGTAVISGSSANDLVVSAMLLLIMLQAIARVAITGGVAETRFRYDRFGVSVSPVAVMPASWGRLRLRGIGPKRTDHVVINQLLIPMPAPGGPQQELVPWSIPLMSF